MITYNKLKICLGGFFVSLLLFSCEKYVIPEVKVEMATFSNDILPLFSKCTNCHSGSQKPNLSSDKAYKSLTEGGYLDLANPEESKLYKKMYSSGHNSILIELEKKKILRWIELGAQND